MGENGAVIIVELKTKEDTTYQETISYSRCYITQVQGLNVGVTR